MERIPYGQYEGVRNMYAKVNIHSYKVHRLDHRQRVIQDRHSKKVEMQQHQKKQRQKKRTPYFINYSHSAMGSV